MSSARPGPVIAALVGTRPEGLKLAPVVRALQARGHASAVLASGQHPAVAATLLPALGIAVAHDLGIFDPALDLTGQLAAIMAGVAEWLARQRPALLLVQGDTTTALAGALAAFHARVPLAHVEAGLRTHDLQAPFPEEANRALIARLAVLHFAPTVRAAACLHREGVAGDIHVTGNSAIDSLNDVLVRLKSPQAQARNARSFPFAMASGGPPLMIATVHRRENSRHLEAIGKALARVAAFGLARLAVPLHPNPMSARLRACLEGQPNVWLLPPLPHEALVWLMGRARLLLTDSGGLQEEAPALGLRTLVVRASTERPEGIAAGVARLVPPRTAPLVAAIREGLDAPAPAPAFPYGDGHAAERIASHIEAWLAPPSVRTRLRPALPSAG